LHVSLSDKPRKMFKRAIIRDFHVHGETASRKLSQFPFRGHGS